MDIKILTYRLLVPEELCWHLMRQFEESAWVLMASELVGSQMVGCEGVGCVSVARATMAQVALVAAEYFGVVA